jgi:hypothetical protein
MVLENLRLYFSLNVREHVSHPYHTTGDTVLPYVLIYTFLLKRSGNKNSDGSGTKHYLN